MCQVTPVAFFGFSPLWAFKCGLKLPAWINAMHCICLTFPNCVLSNVSSNRLLESTLVAFGFSLLCVLNMSSPWENFDLKGPWQKVLTDHKKSLYTLQADPEKSRDFTWTNPGILTNAQSRDPIRAWSWSHWDQAKTKLDKISNSSKFWKSLDRLKGLTG